MCRARELNEYACFAVYIAKDDNDRILTKMKFKLKELPQVCYYNPKLYYIDENEYEMSIQLDKEFVKTWKTKFEALATDKKDKGKNLIENKVILILNQDNFNQVFSEM